MKLNQFLKQENLTYAAFGELVGYSRYTVGKWARDERTPRRPAIEKMYAVTAGAVTANDFMGTGA